MWATNEYKNISISRHIFLVICPWFWSYFWIDVSTFFCFFQEFEKGPTCVSTAPWRVDWGLTFSKSLQNCSKIESKSVLETRPSKQRKKWIFGQLFGGGLGMIFRNICWNDCANVPNDFLACFLANIRKYTRPDTSQIPSRAKAQRPFGLRFWS